MLKAASDFGATFVFWALALWLCPAGLPLWLFVAMLTIWTLGGMMIAVTVFLAVFHAWIDRVLAVTSTRRRWP